MFAAAGLLTVPLLARWDTGQSIRLYELKMIHLLVITVLIQLLWMEDETHYASEDIYRA